MMSNNKILTVSYGTFSCTLEGFDDSFGTMKAIAEYFRDLAADDRYFGAEPPQPDAEMLARIAEKEISRRVEAHEQDGNFVLRAGAIAPAALTTQAPSAVETPADVTPQEAAQASDVPAKEEPEADTAQTAPIEATPTEPEAPKATSVDTLIAGTVADADTNVARDEPEAVEPTPVRPKAEEPQDAAPDADTVEMAEDTIDDVTTPEPAKTGPAVGSIAAKLQRIRDVVAKNQSEVSNGYSEDEHAEEVTDHTLDGEDVDGDGIPDTLNDGFDDNEDTVAAKPIAQNDAEDDATAAMAALSDELDAALDADNTPDTDFDVAENTETVTPDALAARAEAAEDDDMDAALARLSDDLEDDADTGAATAAALEADAEADAAKVAPETPIEAAPQRPRARVIKVKRADLEAAIERGALEEVDADVPDAPAQPSAPGALSPEDEADLMRELAEVEAELSGPKEPASGASQAMEDEVDLDRVAALVNEDTADAAHDAKATKRQLAADAAVKDGALDRLMAEADTMMEEPEGTSRRAAFDHLRAAVVATREDDQLSAEAAPTADDEYRTDLAQAVKPRRPVAAAPTGEARATTERPAPLKLVAAQRIDTPAPDAGPVQPRRVAVASTETAEAARISDTFADYATDRGAHALPELLEAAASYLSFVEGRDQFSRPQLMTKVRQVGPKDFTREDGLRSFGQLLRAGKIEKIKGGRFTVSDDIGFRPEDQRAAG